jgi:hypothetical protein
MATLGPYTDASGNTYTIDSVTGQTNVVSGPRTPAVIPQVAAPTQTFQPVQFGAQGNNPYVATPAQIAAAEAANGINLQQVQNQKAEFDANLEFQRQQMEQIGLPQLVIQQRLADLQQQQFQYQMYLTQQQQGLAQQGLGLQALQAQAQLGGPSNWVQAANFARGLQQTQIPAFMANLIGGQALPAAQGGVGLSQPQSFQTLAGQAGVNVSGSGTPAVTVNGQPVAGGASGFGATLSPALAAMAPLSGGGGAGSPANYGGGGGVNYQSTGGSGFGQFGSGGPAGGTSVRYNAPGPNTPNDTQRGTQIGGTTGMFSGATQNFGYGPGQGSQSVSGTRGTNVVSYDPNTRQLLVDYNFLTDKPRIVLGLKDDTTGKFVTGADPSNVPMGGQQGGGGTGWMNFPYVSGSSGRTGWTLQEDLDPTHQYEISTILPMEGGSTGDQPRFSGQDILSRGSGSSGGLSGQNAQADSLLQNRLSSAYNQDLFKQLMSQPGASLDNAIAQASGGKYTNFGDLQNGTTSTGATTPAAGTPASATTGGPDLTGTLNMSKALFTQGGGALGPQALESMTPTEQQMLQSQAQATGADFPTFIANYLRSRVGQSAAQAA